MAGSLKFGQATASLIVGKWPAASRQNTLATALKERGLLQRTIHAARYLSDPACRRKIACQLNGGESLRTLRRDQQLRADGRPVPDEVLAHICRRTARTSTPSASSPSTSKLYWPSSMPRAAAVI